MGVPPAPLRAVTLSQAFCFSGDPGRSTGWSEPSRGLLPGTELAAADSGLELGW